MSKLFFGSFDDDDEFPEPTTGDAESEEVKREAETLEFSKATVVFTLAPTVKVLLRPTELSPTVEAPSLGAFCDAAGPGELLLKSRDSGPDLITARCLTLPLLPPVDNEPPPLPFEEVFGFPGFSMVTCKAPRG